MPARKRHKKAEEHRDPIVRFAEALKRTQAREEKAHQRKIEERDAAKRAAERAELLRLARVELDTAIAAVKKARTDRRGIAEADETWRLVKAKVIELETGEPPTWAVTDENDLPDGDVATNGTPGSDEAVEPSEADAT